MIRLIMVLVVLVGFLIVSYPFLVAQVSLGKKIRMREIWSRSGLSGQCSGVC